MTDYYAYDLLESADSQTVSDAIAWCKENGLQIITTMSIFGVKIGDRIYREKDFVMNGYGKHVVHDGKIIQMVPRNIGTTFVFGSAEDVTAFKLKWIRG
jgi:hypothetical protein